MAIKVYKIRHTIPKTKLGGFNSDLFRFSYQSQSVLKVDWAPIHAKTNVKTGKETFLIIFI